jgi:hypothetical protein
MPMSRRRATCCMQPERMALVRRTRSSWTTEQLGTLGFSLNAADGEAGDQARVLGGSGWTSSAGHSCSGPSLAQSWRVVRRTEPRAVRRIRPRHPLGRHLRPARCPPPQVSRQGRPRRIQCLAGRSAPTSQRERPSSGGIRASNQLPGGRQFHAWYHGCRQPTE